MLSFGVDGVVCLWVPVFPKQPQVDSQRIVVFVSFVFASLLTARIYFFCL